MKGGSNNTPTIAETANGKKALFWSYFEFVSEPIEHARDGIGFLCLVD